MIRNISEKWGDAISFDTVEDMETTIEACGYDVPDEGLQQGIDYEIDNTDCAVMLIDCCNGQYIAQIFAKLTSGAEWQGITKEDLAILLEGPDNENYCEAWDTVEQNAFIIDAKGIKWTLYINPDSGDLFAINDKFTFED